MMRRVAPRLPASCCAVLLRSRPRPNRCRLIGEFRDWTAYSASEGAGADLLRDGQAHRSRRRRPTAITEAYLYLTHRPAESVSNEINLVAGFNFAADSRRRSPSAAEFRPVHRKRCRLAARSGAERNLAGVMRAGSSLIIEGTTDKGIRITEVVLALRRHRRVQGHRRRLLSRLLRPSALEFAAPRDRDLLQSLGVKPIVDGQTLPPPEPGPMSIALNLDHDIALTSTSAPARQRAATVAGRAVASRSCARRWRASGSTSARRRCAPSQLWNWIYHQRRHRFRADEQYPEGLPADARATISCSTGPRSSPSRSRSTAPANGCSAIATRKNPNAAAGRDRDRLYPRGGSRHALRLLAGRLHADLLVLPHRHAEAGAQPHGGRNPRPDPDGARAARRFPRRRAARRWRAGAGAARFGRLAKATAAPSPMW